VNGQTFLLELPSKFRKSVWIRRGSYVIATTAEELSGTKLQGVIEHVISSDQVKEWKRKGLWPNGFDQTETQPEEEAPPDEADVAENTDELEGDTETR